MGTQTTHGVFLKIVIASLGVIGASGVASAADTPKSASPAPTKEMREKMATVHEQMAACLRSDKDFAECRKEMMQSCHDTLGQNECPMMDMHHHRMMQHQGGTTPPK